MKLVQKMYNFIGPWLTFLIVLNVLIYLHLGIDIIMFNPDPCVRENNLLPVYAGNISLLVFVAYFFGSIGSVILGLVKVFFRGNKSKGFLNAKRMIYRGVLGIFLTLSLFIFLQVILGLFGICIYS